LGGDILDGGEGSDTVTYASAAAGVVVNLIYGIGFAGEALGDTFTDIENIIGSAHDDEFVSSAEVNHIDGGDGEDTLDFSTSYSGVEINLHLGTGIGGNAEGDTYVNIEHVYGSEYADIIFGSNGITNFLYGYGGNDTLHGRGGRDDLYGGTGSDYLRGGGSVDYLYGEEGSDALWGQGGRDILYGGPGGSRRLYV